VDQAEGIIIDYINKGLVPARTEDASLA